MAQPDESELEARLRAALAASRELGSDYDRAMAESIRKLLVPDPVPAAPPVPGPRPDGEVYRASRRQRTFVRRHSVATVSLGLGIPLSAIAGSYGRLGGIAICWAGIVAVNLAERLGRHSRSQL